MSGASGSAAVAAALLSLLIALPGDAVAQSFQQDLEVVLASHPGRGGEEWAPAPVDLDRVAEVETLLAATIRVYQVTLSASDMDACNFWPSCSNFAAVSVQRYGALRGALLAADRLTRCHGLPSMFRHYEIHAASGKFFDPVEAYGHP